MNDCQDKLSELIGAKIVRASSSLQLFAIELDGNKCLIFQAAVEESEPMIKLSITGASQFPESGDAVCAVDWSWIFGGEVTAIKAGSDQVKLNLQPQGPLTVSAGVWQGKAFLSFLPYKAPAK